MHLEIAYWSSRGLLFLINLTPTKLSDSLEKQPSSSFQYKFARIPESVP